MGNDGRRPIFQSSISNLQQQRGSTLVEMALMLPVLLMVLLATFDLGRAVYAQNIINNAAREGARYGSVAPNDTQAIQAQTESFIIGLDTTAATVTVDVTSLTVRVTVTYQFAAVTPFTGQFPGQGGTVTLTAVSTMNIEGSQ